MSKSLLGVLLACAGVWAQTAQINGVVKDPSGLAIPGAAIKATQTATGLVRNTASGTDGGYVLPNLPVGPYLLEVTKEGFNKYAQTGIVLQVDTAPTIDITLQVGALSQQVTVEAAAAQVETRATSIGQVVDNQRIMEMPLNGRDVHQLIFLAGMANFPGTASLNSVRNYPTVVVSVAGGAPDSVFYSLDGIIHQDPYNNLSLPLPFPDAVQEFKVEWSGVPAQYGYHSTATVNAITRSGTNQFHGDLFEFLRNGDLNSRDFFATTRDTLKRNQFGGTLGGPIRKDKLFFFGGYQRTALRSDPSQSTAFIPTPAMAQGDFSACYGSKPILKDPRDPTGQTLFPGNQIDPTLLNPVAANILKTMPATTNACGRTVYGLVANQDEDLVTAKVDWQVNTGHSFFGRFTSAKLNQGSTYDGKNPLSINNFGLNDLDYGLALGHTWVINANLVSSLRVGANRTNIVKVPDSYGTWSGFGANVSPLGGNVIAISTNNSAFAIGGVSASPGQSHNGPLWSIVEDVSWVKGAHQIGFGGSIYRQMLNYWSGVNAVGTATFDGSVIGLPLADFVVGRPVTFNQGTIYGFYSRQYYRALYIQDSWKMSARLTANFGVRWEPYTAVFQKFPGQDEHFDAGLFAQNVHSTIYKNSPAGVVFSGDPQYSCGNYFNCPKWAKFFPRVGLAWDPKGDGRMVIRAAYGMFGDRMSMLSLSQEQFGPPFGNTVSVAGTNLANPWANYGGLPGFTQPGQNPMPTLAQLQGLGHSSPNIPFPTFGTYVSSPLTDFHPTYVNQWNFSIQRQLGQDWLLTANYLGTSTIHFVSGENMNPAVYIPGQCAAGQYGLKSPGACSTTANQNFRRPLYLANPAQGQYYAGNGIVDDGGTGSYEGLNLSARKQLSHGVNVLANYTYSHCISDPWNQNPTNTGVQIPGNRRAWRSNCQGIDLRQLFQLSIVATTPRFSSRVLRILASDWQLAPNLEIKSAQFFTVVTGSDRALTTVANQPPNLVNPNPYPNSQSVDSWVSKSAFSAADPGSYGNLGYNNLKGPGVFQLNLALSRNFPIGERKRVQVRAEAFNLPNHLNPFTPGNAPVGAGNFGGLAPLNAPNFGQITNDISGTGLTTGDYRVIQLAMKYIF
jgi:hypothetical protein